MKKSCNVSNFTTTSYLQRRELTLQHDQGMDIQKTFDFYKKIKIWNFILKFIFSKKFFEKIKKLILKISKSQNF